MGKEAIRHIDARAGGLISFSTRKLPQGQADSLASRIYRRIVEEYGGIDNFINRSRRPLLAQATIPSDITPFERATFALSTSICEETLSQLGTLQSKLPNQSRIITPVTSL